MAAKYYVALTEYGASLIAQAHDQVKIELKDMVIGDANNQPYEPIHQRHRTSLVNQRASVPIQSVEIIDQIAKITATISAHIGGFNFHEYGFTDRTGKLVYIANFHGAYKPIIDEGAGGEIQLITDIKAESGAQVLLAVDPNIVTATKDWVLKIINEQIRPFFKAFLHVGSVHATRSINYDPAIAFEPIFGYRTKWTLRPYALYGVADLTELTDQIINIAGGDTAKAKTLRVWERLPDIDPIYNLTTSVMGIEAGESVIFTLETEHVDPGTIVPFQLSYDEQYFKLNKASKSGTFIIDADGKATYNLTFVEKIQNFAGSDIFYAEMKLSEAPSIKAKVRLMIPRLDINLLYKVWEGEDPMDFNKRFITLQVSNIDFDQYLDEELEIKLWGDALGYLYEYNFVGGQKGDKALHNYLTKVVIANNETGIGYPLGEGLDFMVEPGAPSNIELNADLYWKGNKVNSSSITMNVPSPES
ncbi:phage tail protein [Acinetobacter piscicola]|uniref:phage tail-collar fiber domain-containing protein n=1 Tax=Acinetobacter piscicola TaxID=2006115 RepID=UPI001022426C|nr:phage tail protein [Acinetobacter piscicola]RYL25918.1 hypothetical protein EWP19_10730 [Acinetobacter piscicola]